MLAGSGRRRLALTWLMAHDEMWFLCISVRINSLRNIPHPYLLPQHLSSTAPLTTSLIHTFYHNTRHPQHPSSTPLLLSPICQSWGCSASSVSHPHQPLLTSPHSAFSSTPTSCPTRYLPIPHYTSLLLSLPRPPTVLISPAAYHRREIRCSPIKPGAG